MNKRRSHSIYVAAHAYRNRQTGLTNTNAGAAVGRLNITGAFGRTLILNECIRIGSPETHKISRLQTDPTVGVEQFGLQQ